MRYGQNPIKSVEQIAPPAPVTVVVISYIPFLAGYYEEALDVFKLCLSSMRASDEGAFDLLVFDNASCTEVRDYLLAEQAANRIQYLTLSERNLGKAGAWNIALAAAPGETIIYADSDVRFSPGWLQGHLDLFDRFPKVGMVTGMPILTPSKYSTATLDWAKQEKSAQTEEGALIPWEDFWRHARTLGDNEAEAREFYDANPAVRLSYKGQAAFIGAAHFEFAARKAVLQEVLPIPAEKPMGRVRLLDEAINAAGYLRLNTPDWYVEHMGNSLPAESATHRAQAAAKRKSFWQRGLPRRILQWIYNRTFRLLYRD